MITFDPNVISYSCYTLNLHGHSSMSDTNLLSLFALGFLNAQETWYNMQQLKKSGYFHNIWRLDCVEIIQ